jgi:hypothetical protein
MKVGIQETDLSYVVNLIGPHRNLSRAIPKRWVHSTPDPRARLANVLQELFNEWEITDILPDGAKDRLIQEFFSS